MTQNLIVFFLFTGLVFISKAVIAQDYPPCYTFVDSLTGLEYTEYADEEPSFPGGEKELKNYISTNLKTPAIQECWQGIIYASCIIQRDGSVSGVEIIDGYDSPYDASYLDVLSKMPNWIPAKCGGKNVALKYVQPFRIN